MNENGAIKNMFYKVEAKQITTKTTITTINRVYFTVLFVCCYLLILFLFFYVRAK